MAGWHLSEQARQALRTARYAAAEFEEDLRFQKTIVRLDGAVRQEILFAVRQGAGKEYPLPVLAEAVFAVDELPERRLLTEEYLARGGTDLHVRIESIRFRPEVSPETMKSLVDDGLFTESTGLLTLHEYLQTEEEKIRLRELFGGFSGTMSTGRYHGSFIKSVYREGLPAEITTGPGGIGRGLRIRFEDGNR